MANFDWGQYGLAGLVIFCCFIALAYIGKHLIDRMLTFDKDRQQLLITTLDQHKEERAEWKTAIQETVKETTEALKTNTEAIHELSMTLRQHHP